MKLDDVLDVLQRHAPPRLAAKWDNTGLLLRGDREVRVVGLAIDLSEAVLDELLDHDVDLVIAYHPPIFKGVKRLDGATGLSRMLLRATRAGVSIYAPHTALDAVPGGMGDWLAEALGAVTDVVPIEPDVQDPAAGMGRRGTLVTPTPLRDLLAGLKAHLGLPALRVAGDLDRPRTAFAVCPGAGGDLFSRLRGVDLLVTGEMRHHDVLARVAEGTAVVLTDHTNTERGFLPVWAERLRADLDGVDVVVSTVDADPLTVV
jgi:dinuclear metal center YbgI/SA1388 family protein